MLIVFKLNLNKYIIMYIFQLKSVKSFKNYKLFLKIFKLCFLF